jgi:PBP1b-binding outer membrane lipoprotein LpoB
VSPYEIDQLDKLSRRILRKIKENSNGLMNAERQDWFCEGLNAALKMIERIRREEDRKKSNGQV